MTSLEIKYTVYDFDKTIYDGDSSVDFWLFSIKKYPKILLHIPGIIYAFIKYKIKKETLTGLKEIFFRFLRDIPDIDNHTALFWENHSSKIKSWFLKDIPENTVIISASPEFLIKPQAVKFGVHLIASEVDPLTGRFKSANCKGYEKVIRFKNEFPNASICRFYSDSLSDTPLAEIADEAFLVSSDEIRPWESQN